MINLKKSLHGGKVATAVYTGFPLGLENLGKWEGIFQSGKSQEIFNRLEKSRENHTKYWKTWQISDKCYLLVIFE